jgi:hypothetical protein
MKHRSSYAVAAVACPTCGVEQGKRCRTLTTGRSTDTHEARYDAYSHQREAEGRR